MAVGGLVVAGAANADTSGVASSNDQPVLDDVARQQLTSHISDITGGDGSDDSGLATVDYDSVDVTKQQIIETESFSKSDIVEYTVKSGESIDDIADKHDLTADTIRWSNNVTHVKAGDKLQLPPINGIIYTVDGDDTIEDLADHYDANADYIVAFNDVELSGLKDGMQIVIPEGTKPQLRRSTTSTTSTTYAYNSGGVVKYVPRFGARIGNGQCTDYAIYRRAQIGRPIPRMGSASAWDDIAPSVGLKKDKSPAVGAVVQNDYEYGMTMHVAIVEEILADGSIRVSEQNYPRGYGPRSDRVIPAEHVYRYDFLH